MDLYRGLGSRRVPIQGTMDLTWRCNLACPHCYNRLPSDDRDAMRTELTYEEHCRIMDELSDAGCLWLLFTGGECLLREDFRSIYLYAKQKGFLITIFTNGTLITPELADFLKDWPPLDIEITLYGRTRETYEKVTATPGSYDRCMAAIRLLMERNLPLSLKTLLLTTAVYVADANDATDDFEGAIEHMQALTSLTPDVLFASKLQGQTAPTLLADLAQGVGMVTYLGHGSVALWDNNILDTDSALALANTTFPFFINLTCLNGYFIIPTVDSLATTLLTDTAGGAVGVIASSSLTGFTPQTELGSALLGELFTGATVGEALVAAKRVVSDPDVRRSYLLFGDPSMRVRR